MPPVKVPLTGRLDISVQAARETLRNSLTKNVMENENSVAFTLEVLVELLSDDFEWTEENAQERKERIEVVVRLRGLHQWVSRTDL